MAPAAGFESECFDRLRTAYKYIYLTRGIEFRDGAKKMVAKGKTYGKKKARELVAIFSDLSITPSKPSTRTCYPYIQLMD